MPTRLLGFISMVTLLAFARVGLCEEAVSTTPASTTAPPEMAASDLTIDYFEQLAMTSHPALAEATAAVQSTRGRAIQAGLYPNPTIMSGTNQLGGQQTQFVGTVDQEIVTKGKLRLDRAIVEREVRQAELTYRQVQFEVLGKVRQVFYRTLLAQERVAVLEPLVGVLEQSYNASVRREKGGESARSDTLLLQVELKRGKIRLQNAKTLLDALKRELSTVTGAQGIVVASINGDFRQPLPSYQTDPISLESLSNNSEITRAQLEISRRQTILNRARVEPCPNVTVQAGYQYTVADPNNQAIIQIGVPIPVWNRNQGNILAARADVGRSIEALRRTEVELTRSLVDALGRYQAAQELVDEFEKEILPAARETADLTREAYEKGQFDFLRLLEAQRSLVETNLEFLDAQLSRWLTAVEIAGLLQLEQFP